MNLTEYVRQSPRNKRGETRERLGIRIAALAGMDKPIPECTIRSYYNGAREMPPKLGLALESATGGAVTRVDQWPHIPWIVQHKI